MSALLETLQSLPYFIPRIGPTGLLEIAIIAWMVYEFLYWVNNTKAWVLLRGLIIIGIFVVICTALNLNTILFIVSRLATVALTALVVIFQPELRRALAELGSRSRNFIDLNKLMDSGKADEPLFTEHTINELVKASFELGRAKTGALMVIEQEISLDDIIRTGIDINGIVSSQLLINIFEHNTPLHDGAVVMRGNTIVSATCYLSLSDNMKISKDLGTRHRAANGISETTDSVTIVVSEETGGVSVARGGTLLKIYTPDELRELLEALADVPDTEKSRRFSFRFLKGKKRNERKTDQ